jgi:cytochrome c551/c552
MRPTRRFVVVTATVVAALVLTIEAGARPAAQGPDTAAAMPVAQQNELVQKRCAVCHTDANRGGGLSLQHFDAAQPDPDVARIMIVKITADGAMGAAGQPSPDRPTTAALVEALTAASQTAPGAKWKVELEEDSLAPKTGHALVTARSVDGGVVFSCNGAQRRPRLQATGTTAAPVPADFDGLSPTVRQIFSWCLGGSDSHK